MLALAARVVQRSARRCVACTPVARLTSAAQGEPRIPPSDEALALLACPITKEALRYDPETHELVSDAAGLAFPIQGSILNLMPQDARVVRRVQGDE